MEASAAPPWPAGWAGGGEGEARLRRAHVGLEKAAGLRARPAAVSEHSAIFDKDPTQLAREALADCERGLLLLPGSADAWFLKGDLFVLLERYRDGLQAYVQGLQLARTQGLLVPAELALKLAHLQNMNVRGGGSPPGGGPEEGAGLARPDLAQARVREAAGPPPAAAGAAAGDARPEGAGGADGDLVRPEEERAGGLAGATSAGEEFECSLCLRLLYKPVTTGCGHTFCKSCLGRVADHSSRCPCCRTVMYYFAGEMATNHTLDNILHKLFPEETRQRAAEEAAADPPPSLALAGQRRVLPLFVMTSVFPGERQALNIFEPRYRLLVRRVMAGSRHMGMVPHPGSDGAPLRLGTEVEIVECDAQPDGRFHIEVVGLRRFLVEQDWEQDGYRVAGVSHLDDTPPDDPAEADALAGVAEGLVEQIVDKLRHVGVLRSGQAQDYLYKAGEKPARVELERFSFWAASLAPLSPPESKACLETTNSSTRLKLCNTRLKDVMNPNGRGGGSCLLM